MITRSTTTTTATTTGRFDFEGGRSKKDKFGGLRRISCDWSNWNVAID
jgi:hypothetical protein